ncbi:hypothetical protein WHR41_01539 [Cladosporium halotolerans]|uniref:Heterokaryon incompatibility domain-containing protein n=1 Tax=Cladosporium halotolerans TaxID=1052096 RepID=A0AB34L3H1_9PEZI
MSVYPVMRDPETSATAAQLPVFAVQPDVNKIAKIFAGSFERLASLPQEDAARARIITFHEQQEELLRRTIKWLVLLGEDFDRFTAALKAFGRRPFFSRMWTYQELYLAARIKMVCGTHRTNMQALKDVS